MVGLAGLGVGCGEDAATVVVPDVVGMPAEDAFAVICDAGLVSELGPSQRGHQSPRGTDPDEAGRLVVVVETSPTAGSETDEGSAVTLVLRGPSDTALLVDEGALGCRATE